MPKLFITFLLFLVPTLVYAQFTVPQGGTGTTTFPNSYVLVGSTSLRVTAVATSSLGFPVPTFATTSLSALLPLVWNTTTAQLSTLFSTTTTTGIGNNLILYTNPAGIMAGAASSTLFGVTTPGFVWAFENGAWGAFPTSTVTSGVTSVTATYPILSTGGATPVISTAFGTTTSWGIGTNGFVIAGATGIPFVAASSTLNLPNAALTNSSVTVNTTAPLGGGGAVSLGGTLTLTCASCGVFSYPFNSGTFGTTNVFSTTTAAFLDYLGLITATSTVGTLTASSSITDQALATPAGTFIAADPTGKLIATTTPSSSGSTFAYPFTSPTNFATTTAATTTPLWAQFGIFASSTSYIASTTFAINGRVGIGSTTPAGVLSVSGSTTPLIYIKSTGSLSAPKIQFENAEGDLWHMGVFGSSDKFTFAKTGVRDVFAIDNSGANMAMTFDPGSGGKSVFVNGNVGIGSTSPWGRLSVDTTNLTSSQPEFVVGSSTRSDFFITQAGNVSIGGTGNPIVPLLVNGRSGLAGSLSILNSDWTASAGSGLTLGLGATSGNTYSVLNALSSGVGAGTLVLNSNGGNVGVGTTTPDTNLVVASSVSGSNPVFAFNRSSTGGTGFAFNNVITGDTSDMIFAPYQTGGSTVGALIQTSNAGTPVSALGITGAGSVIIPNGIATSSTGVTNKAFLARLTQMFASTTPGLTSNVVFTGAANSKCVFAGTTLTCPSNVSYFTVIVTGGGASGATGGQSDNSTGGGGGGGGGEGGSGGRTEKLYSAPLATKYYFSVGNGASSGAGADSAFGDGSATTTGSAGAAATVGGTGGGASAAVGGAGGAGGAATGGDFNYPGQNGNAGSSGTFGVSFRGGTGGGDGGQGGLNATSGAGNNGTAGVDAVSAGSGGGGGGGGGSGAVTRGNGGAGGKGSTGFVEMTIYTY